MKPLGRSTLASGFLVLLQAGWLALTQVVGLEAAQPVFIKEQAGQVEGIITFRGEIPKSLVTDDAGVRRELLSVDHETRGLRDVVVWLEITGGSPNTKPAPALMDQRGHEFVPRVLAVRAGQPVRFTNSDPANHNVRTTSLQPTNDFNVFTGVDGFYTHRFSPDPEHRPVRVDCDIHPWMRGWIYVFEGDYFAVTDERGRFRIRGVPSGRYKLQYRQPDIRHAGERVVVVPDAGSTALQIEITAQVPAKPTE